MMGSVKDLVLYEPTFENHAGLGLFKFSDRYSVFDWGEMPDQIKNKGKALAVMAAYNFEELKKRGIRTHFRGLTMPSEELEYFLEVGDWDKDIVSECMIVDMAVKYEPTARKFIDDEKTRTKYDYSFFEMNRGRLNNFLIPLEIIFRNGLPKGSSVFKRIHEAVEEQNFEKAAEIWKRLGLTKPPEENQMLPKPVMSYTTKLEPSDRTLTEHEAYRISGLTDEQFSQVGPLALKVNDYINERAEETGLNPHWDGKVEMVYNNGLVLADVLGTLDEDRFGDRISKEFLRQWYKTNQPKWGEACDEYKKTGKGWQERCPIKPINLPRKLSNLVSQMYMSAANKWIQKEIFPNVPELEKVMEDLKPYRD